MGATDSRYCSDEWRERYRFVKDQLPISGNGPDGGWVPSRVSYEKAQTYCNHQNSFIDNTSVTAWQLPHWQLLQLRDAGENDGFIEWLKHEANDTVEYGAHTVPLKNLTGKNTGSLYYFWLDGRRSASTPSSWGWPSDGRSLNGSSQHKFYPSGAWSNFDKAAIPTQPTNNQIESVLIASNVAPHFAWRSSVTTAAHFGVCELVCMQSSSSRQVTAVVICSLAIVLVFVFAVLCVLCMPKFTGKQSDGSKQRHLQVPSEYMNFPMQNHRLTMGNAAFQSTHKFNNTVLLPPTTDSNPHVQHNNERRHLHSSRRQFTHTDL